MRTHQEIDERSLALHCVIADKIRAHPEFFEHVRQTLARWRTTVSSSSQPYLEEWECLMNQGIDVCLDMAVEDSERATALRQSSPFTGVLTNKERFIFLREWNRENAAQRP